jgi:hypothetical protein
MYSLTKRRVITWQPLFAKSPRAAAHVFFDKRLQICFSIPIIDYPFSLYSRVLQTRGGPGSEFPPENKAGTRQY